MDLYKNSLTQFTSSNSFKNIVTKADPIERSRYTYLQQKPTAYPL